MRSALVFSSAAALGGVALALMGAHAPAPDLFHIRDTRGMHLGAAPVQSLGAMTFGPDGTLFIADTRGAALYAFDVNDAGTSNFNDRYLAKDLDAKVAAALGTTRDQIRFGDMATHPTTHNIYLTVSRLGGETPVPALVRVRGPDAIDVVDLGKIRFATTPVPDAPSRDAKTPWGQPQWTLTVTDLAFVDGQLYVAGLSNEQFSSALRRVAFPFDKKAMVTTVEIYHTSHDQYETASPIDAFLPMTIDGTPMLLAGYGCSPIATFRRSELAAGKHIRGRTVAELGGGSRPVDMIQYRQNGKDWVLIANSRRTLIRLDPMELMKAPAMTTPVKTSYQPAGVGYLPVASSGVMHIDNLSDDYVAVLQRDIDTGAVDLTALPKKML